MTIFMHFYFVDVIGEKVSVCAPDSDSVSGKDVLMFDFAS